MDIEHNVTVNILFFAKSKELSGIRETTLQLPRKISYKQLLDLIVQKYNLETIKNNILLAKNEVVCEETVDIVISDRDSIAVIPPLSGG
ncbi:molybdopterin synthase sulfur carrier subunit isoform X2 [Galleria mellonella]|uniref:Molybdopterin synthase sulfur carrier subunit n=1 Tax=Galleria mellonella TaxID=7137 RepID=A0A6J3C970_GALME|nr:molybdopterin synthase sulfur carrier subunit isoform X2 [Galleria mellonella]XP_031769262.1 molybdopterin synthase sulfur carrier subunit isoform X2 [Galleria mellonella]XP_031769266.1 molybdopterin synthase sulfur carrier subunit isoform X2 [Galleria mellonella]